MHTDDANFQEVFHAEMEEWVLPRRQREDQPQLPAKADEGHFPKVDNALIGLALSGGGVRAATYSLGAVQRLSQLGVLPYVDYLSTASAATWAQAGAALQRVNLRTDQPRNASLSSSSPTIPTLIDRSTTVSRTLYVTSEPTATGWRRTWDCLMFGPGWHSSATCPPPSST